MGNECASLFAIKVIHCYNGSLKVSMCVQHHAILIPDSIVVSIPACHAGDPGSIPGQGVSFCCKFSIRITLRNGACTLIP